MAEEEFHEIQLNGKQLVFLFMAGTVAAVVIFLCGLMVGRNLRLPRLQAAAATSDALAGDPTRDGEGQVPPPPTSSEVTAPATIKEDLSYAGRLEDPTPQDEQFAQPPKPAVKAPAAPAAKAVKLAPVPAVPSASAEPAGNGWTVQVQAVKSRQEAEGIARRLTAKGFPAFVTPRGTGALVRYGIRVGKFPKKEDAVAMKSRLEREEQFKPWLTQ